LSFYYLGNARTQEQLDQMRELEADGICLFCPQNLAKHPHQRILHRTAEWTITPNEFPYKGTRLHLLLVPAEHAKDIADLSTEAQQDFWVALGWIKDHFGLTFYSIASRNGDSEYTGGTIRHVHLHVIQGDVDDPAHTPVRTKLSSRHVDPDQLDARFA
jgi:ATP adenylyltransferase